MFWFSGHISLGTDRNIPVEVYGYQQRVGFVIHSSLEW